MADPLSISASMLTVFQVAAAVVRYIGDLKDTSKDLARLKTEIDSLQNLLFPTIERLTGPEGQDLATMHRLSALKDPLKEFRISLEHLEKKLAPTAGLSKARKVLTWQFQKSEIRNIIGTIERQKTFLVLALQSDH
jgi:hypothetical protein